MAEKLVISDEFRLSSQIGEINGKNNGMPLHQVITATWHFNSEKRKTLKIKNFCLINFKWGWRIITSSNRKNERDGCRITLLFCSSDQLDVRNIGRIPLEI